MSNTEKLEEFVSGRLCTFSAYAVIALIVYFLGYIIYYGGKDVAIGVAVALGVMFALVCLGLKLGEWLD